MRTMASRGLRIFGSGTSCTCSFSLPIQQTAFIRTPLRLVKLCAFGKPRVSLGLGMIAGLTEENLLRMTMNAAGAMRLPYGCGRLACLKERFEAAKILSDHKIRVFSEQGGETTTKGAGGSAVVDFRSDKRTAVLRIRAKLHRARRLDVRIG